LDLESDIGASAGSISRIESGKINPTKETILKISRVLDLNSRQIDYLIGVTSEPATEKEIKDAIEEVGGYLEKRGVFAYLLDDRWRIVKVSDSFAKVFAKHLEKDIEGVLKEVTSATLIRVLLDKKMLITNFVREEGFEELVKFQLKRYKKECGFMFDDAFHQESMKYILNDPIASKIWKEIANEKDIVSIGGSYQMYFRFGGKRIPFNYFREYLEFNPRFRVVEQIPKNPFLKFLLRFLG
jgi:transcriptional regulator with XRE-family HTH domain